MIRSPSKSGNGQRRRSLMYPILLSLMICVCAGLGVTLHSAKVAHAKLWARVQDEEQKNNALQQTMAEVKVESVDERTKNKELENQTSYLSQQLRDERERAEEENRQMTALEDILKQTETQLEAAEEKAEEMTRRLANRNIEAHNMKKALYQHKHQIANLNEEVKILRAKLQTQNVNAALAEELDVLKQKLDSNTGALGGATDDAGLLDDVTGAAGVKTHVAAKSTGAARSGEQDEEAAVKESFASAKALDKEEEEWEKGDGDEGGIAEGDGEIGDEELSKLLEAAEKEEDMEADDEDDEEFVNEDLDEEEEVGAADSVVANAEGGRGGAGLAHRRGKGGGKGSNVHHMRGRLADPEWDEEESVDGNAAEQ